MPRANVLALFPWALGREDPIRRRATVFCEALAASNNVTAISLVPANSDPRDSILPNGLREIHIPFSLGFDRLRETAVDADGPAAEIAVLRHAPSLTPAFSRAVAEHRSRTQHTVTIPAFGGPGVLGAGKSPMIIADRVDYLAARAAGYGRLRDDVLERIAVHERRVLREAAAVIVPSGRDGELLQALYGEIRAEVSTPNLAFAADPILSVTGDRRRERKAASSLGGRPVAAIASPADGVDAASLKRILDLAALLRHVLFLVIGPLPGLRDGTLPDNVQCTGAISPQISDQILACVDLAIDPADDGESNGLLIVDFARRGIPLVATPASSRLLPPQAATRAQQGALHLAVQSVLENPAAADQRAEYAVQASRAITGTPA
jgi:hypothetical protein